MAQLLGVGWHHVGIPRAGRATYFGLGLLFAACAVVLPVGAAGELSQGLPGDSSPVAIAIVSVVDRTRLVLTVIELLSTVKVFLQEHSLVPEPFPAAVSGVGRPITRISKHLGFPPIDARGLGHAPRFFVPGREEEGLDGRFPIPGTLRVRHVFRNRT